MNETIARTEIARHRLEQANARHDVAKATAEVADRYFETQIVHLTPREIEVAFALMLQSDAAYREALRRYHRWAISARELSHALTLLAENPR